MLTPPFPASSYPSPGDIARSEFRLVATLGDGWEYTVCERTLPGAPDPERRLLVTVSGRGAKVAAVGCGAAGACLLGRLPSGARYAPALTCVSP